MNETFYCNICGHTSPWPRQQETHRELFPCTQCKSCARFRGIILGLFSSLNLPRDVPLCDLPPRKHISGLGLSDDARYASHLDRVFDYTNTFYHTAPQLDISQSIYGEPNSQDFIICSEVLEHVNTPVNNSLVNLLTMLKPGGALILSTPYLEGYDTLEHFPHLNDYQIINENDEYTLLNTTCAGDITRHSNLVFHGGPGATLEMRVFGEGDLLARLHYVGFRNTEILLANRHDVGYHWQFHVESPLHRGRHLKSQVIVTHRPT